MRFIVIRVFLKYFISIINYRGDGLSTTFDFRIDFSSSQLISTHPAQQNSIQQMIEEYIPRIVQSLIAIPLLILTILNWGDNQIGQNIINLSTVATYVIGLDCIIILYSWYINNQELFHYEFTVLFTMLYMIGKLFEKFHPSEHDLQFNKICDYNLIIVIGLNILFIAILIIVVFAYACRQVYRLMTETLLSASQSLLPNERNEILGMKRQFGDIKNAHPDVSHTCSICLMQFERDNECLSLPVCHHCFHMQCIEGWLQNHSTCPYCRNNLRLSLI